MRQVSGPSRRPSGTSLGVAGRTEINWPQGEANVVSQNFLVSTSRKEISWCNKARLGCVNFKGPSHKRAWAGASRGLGPGPQRLGAHPHRLGSIFRCSEKSPGRGLAKGWESAETAAADVGDWREAGTGYHPYAPPRPPPPPPKFRQQARK